MYLSKKIFLIFLFIFCLTALSIALYIEYVLGHQPCNLCLIERIPYALTIFFIILILKFRKYEKVFFLFTSVLFLILTIISLYHLGIEQGVLKESIFCSLNNNQEILSKEDLLNQLNQMPISCKNVTFKLFGLSLTTYNVLLSLIIFLLSIKQYQNYDENR
tara:strand:- start:27 stop:509 length:483 start_codon:yes stop_codon:yes gene_type:complete